MKYLLHEKYGKIGYIRDNKVIITASVDTLHELANEGVHIQLTVIEEESNEKIQKMGILAWKNDVVFECKKCDQRYDFAIFYIDEPEVPRCKICNSVLEMTKPRFRLGIVDPRNGGW